MKQIKNKYTSMKTVIKILAVLLVISCGNPGTDSNNKKIDSKKEALKKQIDSKKEKISKLQSEVADLQSKLSNLGDTVNLDDIKLVSIQELKTEPFLHYIEVQGSLDGDDNAAVYPEAPGAIESITITVGQHVSKGQIMAKMNDAAVVEQIKGLEASYELTSTMYEKQKSLWDQKIGSEVQYLQAKNAKESLESQLAAVKKQLDMMHIKSPINGIVEENNLKIGQMASPQYPAFRVVSFGKLKVVTDVAEAYASKIKVGDDIIVFLPDIKKEYKAKVTFASNYINQTNRTFRVEANLYESDNNMKANMVAIVKINDYKNEAAYVLPVSYVQKDQNGDYVYIAKQNGSDLIATKSRVTTGQIYNGLAEITNGLKEGDKLINSGYFEIEEGEKVRM
jgi:membrane fusion protein (multidrug efflux system)